MTVEDNVAVHLAELTGDEMKSEVSREAVEGTEDRERRAESGRAVSVEEQDEADQPIPFQKADERGDGAEIDQYNEFLGTTPEAPSQDEAEAEDSSSLSADDEETVPASVASGRLNDLVGLRRKLSEQNQSIEQMRQMMMAQAQEQERREQEMSLPSEEEVYGEEVINDPAIRFLADRVGSVEDMILERESRDRQNYQAQMQQQQEAANRAEFVENVHSIESEYAKIRPDYYQAYDHARKGREAFYSRYPEAQRKQLVAQEEAVFVNDCVAQGLNPAEEVYKMAQSLGWNQSMYRNDDVNVAPAPPSNNFGKIENGVNRGGSRMDSTSGRGGSANPGMMTMKEFMNLPASQRLGIMADENKFEQLAKTGKVQVD